MNKTVSPPTSSESRRVTVPVSPEVHAAFQRLAKASGMSTGKAMAEWLADTLEAVEFMALKVEQARSAPRIVAREMHAYALGLADETGALMGKLRSLGAKHREQEEGGVGALGMRSVPGAPSDPSAIPPPCNTGGKVPPKTQKTSSYAPPGDIRRKGSKP